MHFLNEENKKLQYLLTEAQKLDKQGMLKDQIKMMKDNMKRAQGPKQHYGQGGGQAGSARAQRRAAKKK